MKRLFLLFITIQFLVVARASAPVYQKQDSMFVVRLLKEAPKKQSVAQQMIYFSRKMIGTPYVAKTLDRSKRERLVVNVKEVDCTTFVEYVLALARCSYEGTKSFGDFCKQLQMIRYQNGVVTYGARLHYFSAWIDDNERLGMVKEIQSPVPPFTATQHVLVNYMSLHSETYPQMQGDTSIQKAIKRLEKSVTGEIRRYIPKQNIASSNLYRNTIHDGDIIAIVTNKRGLDTSHIGIAVWHRDGLHMINASAIHHKVVEEPMLLRTYMTKHPSQIGIRIIRPLSK